jgi:hypothetical protein
LVFIPCLIPPLHSLPLVWPCPIVLLHLF